MLTNVSNVAGYNPRPTNTPPPSGFGRQRDSLQSPYSWGRNSNDGLMSSPSTEESSASEDPPQVPKHAPYSNVVRQVPSDELELPSRPVLRQQNSFYRSSTDGDADAKIVRESFIATSRQSTYAGSPTSRAPSDRSSLMPPQMKSAMSSDNSLNTPSPSSSSSSSTHAPKVEVGHHSSSANTTPRASRSTAKPANLSGNDEPLFGDEPLFDLSPNRILAYVDEGAGRPLQPEKQAKRPESKKVLTAAEFKNLRQKENVRLSTGNAADSDSGDDYEDDEDDPALLAQKRKIQQEKDAQFALWRQQNKKAIGDHSAPLPPGYSNPDRSTPHFSLQAPSIAGATQTSLEEDQDDDVPLGILAQHGFPNKKNPPSTPHDARMHIGSPGGGVASGQSRPTSTFRLPPFARKLPEDPYMGTSDLVNPVNRQPLGMGRTGSPSTYGDSGRGGSPSASIPPGGLVGVIQEEERLKSMRRGSPNYNGTYSKPLPQQGMGGPHGQMTPQQASIQQMTYGMGVPLNGMGGQGHYGMAPSPQQYPMNPMMDPAFAQQMTAFMAFQQQMMGQMGGYMGQPGQMGMPGQMAPDQMGYMGYPPQMGMANQLHGMPMTGLPPPQSRPMSMSSNHGPRPPMHQSRTMSMTPAPRPQQSRTMSMMNYQTPMNGFGMQNQVYAPSLAPSERSNIGNPGRYRPVSTIRNGTDGGSTITPSSPGGTSPAFLSATIHTGKKGNSKPAADDQDASEWANLANKRLNRRGE
jgi:hypothetical protein